MNALITGGSRGIGKAIAIALAKAGYNIAINYSSDAHSAQETTKEISKLGVKAYHYKCDISKKAEVEELISHIKKEFGNLHVLVNNAGITKDRTLKNMSEKEWKSVIDTNLNGTYNVIKQSLDLLSENSRIINISSVVGENGNFGQTNYSSSKAGIIGFTKTLAKELGKKNITVNAVSPGFINTEMTEKIPWLRKFMAKKLIPLQEFGNVEDVANAVVFLCSEKSSYITGEVLHVSGGLNF